MFYYFTCFFHSFMTFHSFSLSSINLVISNKFVLFFLLSSFCLGWSAWYVAGLLLNFFTHERPIVRNFFTLDCYFECINIKCILIKGNNINVLFLMTCVRFILLITHNYVSKPMFLMTIYLGCIKTIIKWENQYWFIRDNCSILSFRFFKYVLLTQFQCLHWSFFAFLFQTFRFTNFSQSGLPICPCLSQDGPAILRYKTCNSERLKIYKRNKRTRDSNDDNVNRHLLRDTHVYENETFPWKQE